MPDETTEQNETPNATTGGQSSNPIDKVKNFFTIGGDKNKWRKAIIVSILVVLFMGLSAAAAWGSAIAFYVRSIGDPNGNSAQACMNSGLSGTVAIPAGATTDWHENIVTTTFGGKCDKSQHNRDMKYKWCHKDSTALSSAKDMEECMTCTDDVDNCVGRSGLPTGCSRPTEYFAALPLTSIPVACHGNVNQCPRIEVEYNGKTVVLAVIDSGPYVYTDSGYVLNNARPANRVGLDISQIAMTSLGAESDAKTRWRFTTAAGSGATGGSDNCGATSGSNSSMDFRTVGTSLGQYDQVGIWKNITDVQNAVGTPGKNIVSYSFMGHNISGGVNKAITSALDKVQADLKAAGVTYNFSDVQGTSVRENTNRKGTISPHGFGTAIDINPNQNPNNKRSSISGGQARDSSSCSTNIPKTVSDIFQKDGFFWGGKFFCTCDTMHFQYGGNYDTSQISWPDFKLLPADTTPGCPK